MQLCFILHKKKENKMHVFVFAWISYNYFFFGKMHKKLIKVAEKVERERRIEHTWCKRWSMHCIHCHIVLMWDTHFKNWPSGGGWIINENGKEQLERMEHVLSLKPKGKSTSKRNTGGINCVKCNWEF